MLVRRIFSKVFNIGPRRTAISMLSGLIIGFFILGLVACNAPYILMSYLDGNGELIEIIPNNPTLTTQGTTIFTATGGTPPYFFSVVSGTGSIDRVSGEYSSVSGGSALIRVVDSISSVGETKVEVVATANTGLWITPASVSLMEGEVIDFRGGGGTPPYTYSILKYEGSVDPVTGTYTAPSPVSNESAAIVEILDSDSEKAQAVVHIQNPADSFSVTQIPSETVIYPWKSVELTAVGASNPSSVKWSSDLPTDGAMPSPGETSIFTPKEPGVALITIDDGGSKIYRLIIVVRP